MTAVGALIVSLLTLTLCGCATLPPNRCESQERVVVNDMLYFGTATAHGVVSRQQWNEFVNTVVTPRFPMGLTVWPASGQWQSADGHIIHEVSHVLALVHADDPGSDLAVLTIVSTYKTEFDQEAVLRVRSAACASP